MRWKRYAVARTTNGAVISAATVDVYLAGGTTAANAYEAPIGGSAVNQVIADSQGRYEYYVDASEYSNASRFKEIITKGSANSTIDNIPIVRFDPTVDQSLAGELSITGTGHGITFPDGTRMTSMASPGSGVTAEGDISIAADTEADGSGEITFSTYATVRARIPNGGGLEINDGGTWRQAATQDGAEILFNKTLESPVISGFAGAKGHRQGLAPRYKDTDELYIGSGVIEIDGAICELEAETAFDMNAALGRSLTVNNWYCFGFKKPASGVALTSSELITSQIMPTWDESRQGWYLPAPHSGGVSISGGDTAGTNSARAFILADNPWVWDSSQTGASVSGAAYIGYDFGSGITCAPTAIFIAQSMAADSAISSAKLQYSENDADWYDHETVTITDPNASLRGEYITLSTPGGAHRYWRLLANDDPATGNSWRVLYLHFVSGDTEWARVAIDAAHIFTTDSVTDIDASSKWTGNVYGGNPSVILNDNMPAYSTPEAISADVPELGVPLKVQLKLAVQDGAAGSDMYIYSGSSTSNTAVTLSTQAANQKIQGAVGVITTPGGTIYHQGENLTYSLYIITRLDIAFPR